MMALDKLVDSSQLDTNLTSVANAIRAKGGTSGQLQFPQGFVDAVEAIETGGGGVQTITFLDWENSGVTSSNGTRAANSNRCLLPHLLCQFTSMTVPSNYKYAIFAVNKLGMSSSRITTENSYVGGWTGSEWQKTLTWHNGGSVVDFTALPNWGSYGLVVILRNASSDSAISTSAGANVEFAYNPADGAFVL